MNQSIKLLLLCITGFLIVSGSASAQVDKNSELFKILKTKDSILFKIGFNKCQVEKSAKLMFDDLEFYHDKSGITNSKEAFVKTMKNGLCRKDNPKKVYRFLVEESIDVFPMYNNGELYGALQNGKHFFSPDETMTYEKTNNYALFSHLWILENNEWKLKRVISYNHVSKTVNPVVEKITVPEALLKTYSGNYKTKTEEITVSIVEGTLHLNAGKMKTLLVATAKNVFTHPQAPLTFEFVKNEKGVVSKILVKENGKIVEEVNKI